MILKNYKNLFIKSLSNIYPKDEIDTFFFYLIEEYLQLKRIDISLQPNFEINDTQLKLLNSALERLQKEEPIQYILGKTEFFGYPFFVNEHTLIPRPETEELVEWILNELKSQKVEKLESNKISILDMGTGSGCIPISLAKNLPNAKITAIDISEEALNVAQKNALLNKVDINFMEFDILSSNNMQTQFDIIVSNPPYVRELEKKEIKNNVLHYEPHSALFVPDDNPLLFYDAIASFAKNHLSENGLLFFEINQYLAEETVQMLLQKGFSSIILKKDGFGNNRMIKASI